MGFEIDKQSIRDLELFNINRNEKSVFDFFNYTESNGGNDLLRKFFTSPSNDLNQLNERVEAIKFFIDNRPAFRIEKERLDFIEYYLTRPVYSGPFKSLHSIWMALKNFFRQSNDYYVLLKGTKDIIYFLNELRIFASYENKKFPDSQLIKKKKSEISEIIENSELKVINKLKGKETFLPYEYLSLSIIFRKTEVENLRKILYHVYEIDVIKALAYAANRHRFTTPDYSEQKSYISAMGVFHPFLKNPVVNDIEFNSRKNLCFITGPNMAGKSTFLKSICICIYLSHIGFPVPAHRFTTSVFCGLITTINLPDNLNKGYSHFYNEVLRVKYAAEKVAQLENVFVVFDELFRGTNIKDAYDASLLTITELSKLNKSVFAISTHIVEIADQIRNMPSVFFRYFEANLVNESPQYNFKAKEGVTNERIGLYILKKEKVIDIIRNAQ